MLVAICVFTLFHPSEFELQPAPSNIVVIEQNGHRQTLEGKSKLTLRASAQASGRDGADTSFILSIPGKIRREFHGRLEIRESHGQLQAIVTMDRETAVASIVAAESPPGAPLEALKAQAVVARSFLVAAHYRHEGFDFCDTTHCQFLREAPAPGSPAATAAAQTRDLMLAYQGRPIAALYSANCGGETQSLEQAGWNPEPYPYFGVKCPIQGEVSGHRIGMCQQGAAQLARMGKTFREILSQYFPATTLTAPVNVASMYNRTDDRRAPDASTRAKKPVSRVASDAPRSHRPLPARGVVEHRPQECILAGVVSRTVLCTPVPSA